MSWSLSILLVLILSLLVWLLRGSGSPEPPEPAGEDDADRALLGEAEEEVRDVDAFTTPDDAEEELPDWGPGAPRG